MPTNTRGGRARHHVPRLAADLAFAGVTGRYFNRDQEERADQRAYNAEARTRLRSLSDDLCRQDA